MPRLSIEESIQQRNTPTASTGAREGFDVNAFQSALGQPAQQTTQQQESSPILQQVGTGAAKELGNTGIGIGSLGRGIQKGLSKGVDSIFGTTGFGLGGESLFDKGQKRASAQEFLKPEGGPEKTGAFATEAATFAIPGAATVKATKGANFLTRAAALGATDAGVTVAQSGEFNREAVDAAIIGAAFPVVGRGAQLAKGALPSGADAGGKVINSLVKPLLKDFSYGKNPGKAVAEAGITANSLDELGQKITVVRQGVGQEISDRVIQSTTKFDASDSLKSLDEAIGAANKNPRTNSAIIKRLEDLKSDLLNVGEDGIPTRNLKDLTADELWELNKDIGGLTRWTGNATDDEIVNKALRNAYGATRGKLEGGVDGIGELSEKYANLKSAEIATQYRDKIAARGNIISFSGNTLGGGAALATALTTGGAAIPALLVGGGVGATTEALKSTAVKTRVAAWLASSSKEEVEKAFKDAPWLRSTLQASLFGEETADEDSSSNTQ